MNEQIEMYRAVQDKRGPWRILDHCWHLKFKNGLGVVIGIGKNSVLSIYFRGMDHHSYCEPDDPDLLWLPPTAPGWNDDGRNLWAMVDWEKWGICVDENRRILIHERKYDIVYFEADTLPEALLRAIERKGE